MNGIEQAGRDLAECEAILRWIAVQPLQPDDDWPAGDHGWVYLIRSGESQAYKIGWTGSRVATRVLSLQGGNPERLFITWRVPGSKMREHAIHIALQYCRLREDSEWFTFESDSDAIASLLCAHAATADRGQGGYSETVGPRLLRQLSTIAAFDEGASPRQVADALGLRGPSISGPAKLAAIGLAKNVGTERRPVYRTTAAGDAVLSMGISQW